jgi:hypothetical protein
VAGERINLQKGMNFGAGNEYSTSLIVASVRLLCAKHNLKKSDKIMSVLPWFYIGAETAIRFHRN